MHNTIVTVFDSKEGAEAARRELIDVGIPADDVHIRGGGATGGEGSVDDDRDTYWRRVLGSTDAGDEPYGHYAEAERRGNAVLIVEDVEGRETASIETALVSHGVLDIEKLAEDWRARGWRGYDERAPALSPAELEEERSRSTQWRAGGESSIDSRRCVQVYSIVVERSMQPGVGTDRPGSARQSAK